MALHKRSPVIYAQFSVSWQEEWGRFSSIWDPSFLHLLFLHYRSTGGFQVYIVRERERAVFCSGNEHYISIHSPLQNLVWHFYFQGQLRSLVFQNAHEKGSDIWTIVAITILGKSVVCQGLGTKVNALWSIFKFLIMILVSIFHTHDPKNIR